MEFNASDMLAWLWSMVAIQGISSQKATPPSQGMSSSKGNKKREFSKKQATQTLSKNKKYITIDETVLKPMTLNIVKSLPESLGQPISTPVSLGQQAPSIS